MRAAAMLPMVVLGACATERGFRMPSIEEATELECQAEARGPYGQISGVVLVAMDDGSRSWLRVAWRAPEQRQPVSLSSVVGRPVEARFPDDAPASVAVTTLARVDGRATMELRAPEMPPIVLGSFARRHSALLSGGRRRYTGEISWGALRAAMAGRNSVQVALVGERGRDLTRGWIDATIVAAADEALAALRPRLETLLADPRRNCAVPPTIIVARPDEAAGRTG